MGEASATAKPMREWWRGVELGGGGLTMRGRMNRGGGGGVVDRTRRWVCGDLWKLSQSST